MPRNYRFTVSKEDKLDPASARITIGSKELLHQLNNVLRVKAAHREEITMIDGSGMVFYVELQSISKSEASFKILRSEKSQRELASEIYFLVPVIKLDAFSWMLRKLTELGVQHFIPVIFERSQKQNIKALSGAKVHERLTKIIQESVEQCEGAVFPELHSMIEFAELSKSLPGNTNKIFASERLADEIQVASSNALSVHASDNLCLLVGPEGGLTDAEVKALEAYGFNAQGLGRRLLKAETAAIALFSSIKII